MHKDGENDWINIRIENIDIELASLDAQIKGLKAERRVLVRALKKRREKDKEDDK